MEILISYCIMLCVLYCPFNLLRLCIFFNVHIYIYLFIVESVQWVLYLLWGLCNLKASLGTLGLGYLSLNKYRFNYKINNK